MRTLFLKQITCISFLLLSVLAKAQPTNYTHYYNSGNFVKTIDFSKPIGDIEGNASSTASGGLSYSIPIFACPGTNGIQPTIALVYNSQGGSSIAGYGWNISGLSAITRTGKNMYHNGIVKAVSYTSDDAFLLDGMRLNAIAGNNGANGTIYAGEAESFAKIISNTSASNDNPDWFQVTAKDGSTMEFGNSNDSRLLSDNFQSVIMWRLNKVIDVNGNYVEFKYDNTNRDSRIQQILYTGNSNAGLLPYNQINFAYSVRADQNTSYDGGASLNSQYLLDKISVLHTNDAGTTETVKTYKLNYGFDNVHSMLKEIIEFGGDDNATSLNSTIFLYGDLPNNISTSPTINLQGTLDCYSGDFDGDGKTDLLVANKYFVPTLNTFLNTGYSLQKNVTGSSPTVMYLKQLPAGSNINILGTKLNNFLTSDYDGDGRDDILYTATSIVNVSGTTATRRCDSIVINYTKSFNSGTGTTNYLSVAFPPPPLVYGEIYSNGRFFIPGDFDGNGNQDYILIVGTPNRPYNTPPPYPNKLWQAYLTSPSTAEVNIPLLNFGVGTNTYPQNYSETIANADVINTIDFDGDGKMELLVTKDQISYILSLKKQNGGSSYTSTLLYTTQAITKECKYFPGDFNGDKKTDLLIHYPNGTWNILYSTGSSFISQPFYFNNPVLLTGQYSDDKIVVADFNGDGKSDILHGYPIWSGITSTSSKLSLYYSKGGNSFFNEQYDYNKVLPFVDFIVGDFNGDGRTDLLSRPNANSVADFINIKPLGQELLLQKITTGHNITTAFTYKTLTDQSENYYYDFYKRSISLDDPANLNPYNYVQLPMYALYTSSTPDGIGGNNVTEYSYEDAVVHRAAKGLLGFKKITAKNNVSGITYVAQSEINTQFAVPYQIRQATSLTATGQLLSESLITISFDNLSINYTDIRYFAKNNKTLNIDYLNGKASEVTHSYDGYGNINNTISKVGTLSGNTVNPIETTVSTANFSIHNTPVPAKPDNITVTNTRVGMPSIYATTTYTYTANGLQASQTNFSGQPKAVTITTTYNNFGNPISATTSALGMSNRIATTVFDAKGRFVIATQKTGSGLSQTETYTLATKWGLPLLHTSADCLTTTNEYDNFGHLIHTILPNGNNITVHTFWHTTPSPFYDNYYRLYYTLTQADGKPDTKIYFDKFNREWKQEIVSMYGATNAWHTRLTTYDNRGNVKTKSNSFFPCSSFVVSNPAKTNKFVEINRPNPIFTQPCETPRITTYDFDNYNRVISVANDIGTATSSYASMGNGQMQVTVIDPSGQSSSKITDATGKVISSTDNGGQLNFTYDSRGSQVAVTSNGNTLVTSQYDSYGKQINMTDLNAGTTTYSYDAYGQLTQQTDAKGNTYTMAYDDFGRILTHTGAEGTTTYQYYVDAASGCSNNNIKTVTGFNGVVKDYSFDALKRPIAETQTIDGTAYTTSFTYDNFSNISSTTYPSGVTIANTYDAFGYLTKITETSTVTNLFYNAAVDGEGKHLLYTLGNGFTTTNTYNKDYPATTTTPNIQNLSYNFELTSGNLLQRSDNLKGQIETFTYDNLNRLTSVTPNYIQQLGITYDATGNATMGNIVAKTDAGYYKYRSDKINAVAYVMNTPTPGQSPVTPTPASTISQIEQNITYTPFLKVATISEGANSFGNYQDFTYGPDYERVKSYWLGGPLGNSQTKYYVGNYEKQITKNGILGPVTREIHYICGGNGLCAIIVKEAGVITPYFVYTDHLGSITTVTNSVGTVVAEQSFDAWGRQRNPTNWNSYTTTSNPPNWLYRGYTGHEMMPGFNLINMNGRMYDPVLGRMLSPDNYLQAPYNSQNYNRYSYALNNPLKFTDPSGNFFFAAIIVGAMIGGFLEGIHYDMSGKGNFFDGFWRGAIVGGAAAGIGAGITSGISSAMAGGSFSAGFMGTTSVASTGFAAGFVSGAAGGLSSGFVYGLGGGLLDGNNIGQSLSYSLKDGIYGAISGGILGGLSGGKEALKKGMDYFSGKGTADLSKGYGAFGLDPSTLDKTVKVKYVGQFQDANVYETSSFGEGAGLTLPGLGITVGTGTLASNSVGNSSWDLLAHEYGHILEAKHPLVGLAGFYRVIAPESLASATFSSSHSTFWTETWANYLSHNYFIKQGISIWNFSRFPVKDLSTFNFAKLLLTSRPFPW